VKASRVVWCGDSFLEKFLRIVSSNGFFESTVILRAWAYRTRLWAHRTGPWAHRTEPFVQRTECCRAEQGHGSTKQSPGLAERSPGRTEQRPGRTEQGSGRVLLAISSARVALGGFEQDSERVSSDSCTSTVFSTCDESSSQAPSLPKAFVGRAKYLVCIIYIYMCI
jgi:hypothetical protein